MVEEILAIMEARGITEKEMAEIIGLTTCEAFYYRASGNGDFSASEIEKMCMVLGLEIRLEDVGGGWDMEAWRQKRDAEHPRKRRRSVKK